MIQNQEICFHSRITAFFLRLFDKSPVKLEINLNGSRTSIHVNRRSLEKAASEAQNQTTE